MHTVEANERYRTGNKRNTLPYRPFAVTVWIIWLIDLVKTHTVEANERYVKRNVERKASFIISGVHICIFVDLADEKRDPFKFRFIFRLWHTFPVVVPMNPGPGFSCCACCFLPGPPVARGLELDFW